ncbi:TetR/AcrR family transcriptional regulator [Phreatobacter stygius]|uniref:TetR/AcrR family transcriptional regulator n=1 Tax=Phreatobacter stygius TaxID=1940610 RepID=A0A4D7AVU5_9HYPH|nr:TetR/AcrR family transcriptional regulator [Phreatobacter stygius]QCI63113.1 TetR/AcrR family transcriptional regulator [Phreatobacter stygius]
MGTSTLPMRASPFLSAEDKDRERRQKKEAVLREAARLFCHKGYNETQMSDVASQLGVTKPTIYYYFKNKEEVLVGCFEVGFEMIEATLKAAETTTRSGAERLRNALQAYAEIMTQDFGKCAVRVSINGLSQPSRESIDFHRRRIDARIRALVADAVKDGSIRPCDPKIATFTMLGSLNGIGRWHRADGELAPAELAKAVVAQVFAGLEPQPRP